MAIKQSYDFQGLTLPDAYIRVDRIFGGKREGWNSIISIYASQEAAETHAPLEQFNCPAPYDEQEMNPFKKVYGELKKDGRFKNGQDC